MAGQITSLAVVITGFIAADAIFTNIIVALVIIAADLTRIFSAFTGATELICTVTGIAVFFAVQHINTLT